jgi:heat shock protein HslJ
MREHARFGLLAIAALAAACGSTPATHSLPSLDGTAWVLEDLTGRTLIEGPRPTLQFTADRLSGTDGCNRFSGRYTVAGRTFKVVPPLASTQKACLAAVEEQARAYLDALTVAGSYQLAEGKLRLIAASGAPLATFSAQSSELANTSWRVTGINNGRGAVAGVDTGAGVGVTVEFGSDGQVSGWAGCNRWSATYTTEGSNLRFGAATATGKVCDEPGVMAREQDFLNALAMVRAARAEGDRLELRTEDGAMALVLYREGSD